ncbi:histone PARylation factor 1-like isoform X2 [Physella acuta]|uniref:histone PARylation factor 1-like isoform X2 n=1 Tax=Physella acuta TaxID=109671 RepID=UPI0027DEA3AF|nr:histone PARylation factor 1-like isoform X2 [Physella acuta]
MAAVVKKNKGGSKPVCKYGSKCYRKNPQHLQNYQHPENDDEDNDADKESKVKNQKVNQNSADQKPKRTLDDFFGQPKNKHDISDSDDETKSPPKKKIMQDEAASCLAGDTSNTKEGVESDDKSSTEGVESNIEDEMSSPPASPQDVKDNIKNKFLVEMPEDFYLFWEFCKSSHPSNPSDALLSDLNLRLVGPFDILSERHKGVTKNKHKRRPNFLLHYRYFYDPPEFQSVITSQEPSLFHLGYYRDDPKDPPVFVASNAPGESSKEKISPCGENIFAAVHIYASKLVKGKSGKKKSSLEKLIKGLEKEALKHSLPLAPTTKKLKDRQKKVVCPTFHGAGIVVPVDDNDVGYRPVPETPAALRAMFKRITEGKTETEREKSSEELQELITFIQFANDECDYGEGLELGLDLFSFGSKDFHPQIGLLLPLAYQLLNRSEFAKIIEAHLKCRKTLAECVDELAQ